MANSKGNNSVSSKAYYAKYDPTKQRRKRLERHLKKQPNDKQAQEALKDPKLRGPKPSKKENGWLTHEMTKMGFNDTDNKKSIRIEHVNPKMVAWVRSIMKKAEAQHQHNLHYAPKSERAKGGQP